MAKVPQTLADLKRHLSEQLRFLRRSADAFDKGDTAEAKRIANHIRTLVHKTHYSKSLLGLLGERNRLFYDTSIPDESGNLAPHLGLIVVSFGGSGNVCGYAPRLDDEVPNVLPRQVPLDIWWTTPILRSQAGHVFTRRDLVLSVANQDGGAHVDPSLSEQYGALSRTEGLGWKFQQVTGTPPDARGAELAAVRQIGHEVLKTFDPFYQCARQRPVGATIAHMTLREATPEEETEYERQQTSIRSKSIPRLGSKVGRNQPCPCGSGKKYKRCCGR
jgi:hypothetical protein